MKTVDRIILWTLGIGFPVVVGLMIFAYSVLAKMEAPGGDQIKSVTGGIWDYLGVFFICWLILAVIMLCRLLINSKLRETILSFIARIKERDEREAEISGHAAKFTFFANLALLVFLLFFSALTVHVDKRDTAFIDGAGDKKHGMLTLGLGLRAYDKDSVQTTHIDGVKTFKYKELPISKSGIIILLIVWQMGMYHLSARKKSALT